jgi:hypothetical protein
MRTILALAILIISVATAVPAAADGERTRDQHRSPNPDGRTEMPTGEIAAQFDRLGDRIHASFDDRAYLLSERIARLAARAEAAGDFALAHRLHVKGERLRQHFDRKGDRIDARLDRRGERLANRVAQRWQHRVPHDDRHPGWRDQRLAGRFGDSRYGGRCR